MTGEHGRVRAAILAAAEELFVRRGYHALSMREIAGAVGVSKAALYYHFADKEALFLAVLNDYLAELGDLVARVQQEQGEARPRLQALARGILGQPPEKRALIRLASQETGQISLAARLAFNERYQERFLRPLQAIFEEGIAAGQVRPLAAPVMVWAFLGMLYPYLAGGEAGLQPDPAVEPVLEILFEGILK